ncbi:MAG TPA: prolyl oligopeptidase family serine peptidase, partial [Burkholderiaceae bacterium]
MRVHGYLTLPPGRDARTVPLVAIPHAGPWAHIDTAYSSLDQMLANRGYAVFQPNFRGSTGYGFKYLSAPGNDFARATQDLTDGVRWLLANGVGDAKRVGLFGNSFGGYAVLMAMTHAPELYRFGLAMVPPTDFAQTLRGVAASDQQMGDVPFPVYLAQVGIAADKLQTLAQSAPLAHTGKLRGPLAIVAGGKDDKVPLASVTDYVARLQARNHPVTLLVDADEGHNPRKPVSRTAVMYLLDRMLELHLGGAATPAADASLAKYLEQTVKTDAAGMVAAGAK